MKIMIDAGHRNNINDFGATGNGLKESKLALSVALKLKKELEQYFIKCYTTRDSELTTIGLNERCLKANQLAVDLFVSIHINSAERKEAAGVEVLYYDDFDLAKKVCDSIVRYTGAPNRGAKERHDLKVLNGTMATAILVECGFISNSVEAKLLNTDAYQNKIVKAISESVLDYFNIKNKVDNQTLYLQNLILTGNQGQKEWAKQQLEKN